MLASLTALFDAHGVAHLQKLLLTQRDVFVDLSAKLHSVHEVGATSPLTAQTQPLSIFKFCFSRSSTEFVVAFPQSSCD